MQHSVISGHCARLRPKLHQSAGAEFRAQVNTPVMAEYFTSVVTMPSVQAAKGAAVEHLNQVIAMAMSEWPELSDTV